MSSLAQYSCTASHQCDEEMVLCTHAIWITCNRFITCSKCFKCFCAIRLSTDRLCFAWSLMSKAIAAPQPSMTSGFLRVSLHIQEMSGSPDQELLVECIETLHQRLGSPTRRGFIVRESAFWLICSYMHTITRPCIQVVFEAATPSTLAGVGCCLAAK